MVCWDYLGKDYLCNCKEWEEVVKINVLTMPTLNKKNLNVSLAFSAVVGFVRKMYEKDKSI